MGDQTKLRVEYLSEAEALVLFQRKVTDNVLNAHPDITGLAVTVAELCGGLPLPLIIIGSTMKKSTDPDVWSSRITKMKNYPAEFPGIVGCIEVLLNLRKELFAGKVFF